MLRLARPRFSLRFKLLVSHLLVLAPFPIFFAITQKAISDADERTRQETARHLDQIPLLLRLEILIGQYETAAMRFMATGRPEFKHLIQEERKNVEGYLAFIPTESDVETHLQAEIEKSFQKYSDLVETDPASAEAMNESDPDSNPHQALRNAVQRHRAYHVQAIEFARKDLARTNREATQRWVYGTGLALGLAVIAALLLTRVLLRPVTVLEETLRAYERGEAPPKPASLPGDEIGDLGRSMQEALSRMDDRRERLERLTLTDPLTGLHNRRYLDEILGRLRKRETPAAFVMIDIDHFKAYNDREGHLMGDQLLQEVADLLHRNVRPGDVVARYGGEEFCALFLDAAPGERPAGPETVERLRILFENHPFPRTESQPGGRLTISIGGTHWKPGEEPRDALQRADTALYQAKQSGRNRCAWS